MEEILELLYGSVLLSDHDLHERLERIVKTSDLPGGLGIWKPSVEDMLVEEIKVWWHSGGPAALADGMANDKTLDQSWTGLHSNTGKVAAVLQAPSDPPTPESAVGDALETLLLRSQPGALVVRVPDPNWYWMTDPENAARIISEVR